MKKLLIISLIIIGFGAALLLWRVEKAPMPQANTAAAETSTVAPHATSATEPEPTAQERSQAGQIIAAVAAREAQRFSAARIERGYRYATDAHQRWLMLAELQDRRFPRDEAVRVLTSALADSNLKVRVYAAELLYKLGASAGRETLLAALRSVAALPAEEMMNALRAATILDQNQEIIPAPLLLGVQGELGNRWVVGIMARQGDPQYLPYLMAFAQEEPTAGSLLNLGLLGDPGGYSLAKQVFETTQNETTRAAAAWTLFRTGGDHAALAHVLAIAQQTLTTTAGFGATHPDTVQYAMRGLYATPDERVQELLRQVVGSAYGGYGNSSLASLFYVQRDYAFVDGYLRNYLGDRKAYPYTDPALIGRILAARNQPALNALAAQAGTGFRDAYLEPMRGLPVESWISLYLSDLPRRPVRLPPPRG